MQRTRPRSNPLLIALPALVALCLGCGAKDGPPEPSGPPVVGLFEELEDPTGYEPPPGPWAQEEVRRARFVRFDAQAFRERVQAAAEGEPFSISLFPDVSVLLTDSSVRELEDGTLQWQAGDRTEHYTRLSVMVADSAMLGTVRVDDQLYEITPVAPNVVRIAEIDQARFPEEAPPRIPPREEYPALPEDEVESRRDEPQAAEDDAEDELLVLVVLPQPAYSLICDEQIPFFDLMQLVENAFESNLNDVFRAVDPSGVSAEVEVVCHRYGPVGGDLDADLDFVTDDTAIGALRDARGADLVSLVVPSADFCGLGWEPYPISNADEARGFSVVKGSCALDNHSFAHELGHNFGMRHDRQADSAFGSDTCNYGHVFPVDLLFMEFDARTVMAYGSSCGGCPRFGVYSTPLELDLGALEVGPFGVSCGSPPVDGVYRRANNRGQLIDAAPTVAAYR